MARRDYVVEGAQLECTLGTAPGELVVTSQQKVRVKKKLKATNKDKMLKPPFFGSCTCSSPNPPCSPVFKEWRLTSKKSTMGDKTFLMADSKIQCEKGGTITIKDVGQDLVGTGKKEPELDDKYPELKGEIIFANGYLSSSMGGTLNALLDFNPDEPDPGLRRGHNMNEDDKLDPDDMLTPLELENINAKIKKDQADAKERREALKKELIRNIPNLAPFPLRTSPVVPPLSPIPLTVPIIQEMKINLPTVLKSVPEFTSEEIKDTFWGYWNQIGNFHRGSQTYAKYFNAENREHFLNGSHGLGSNAAHRMDHGIAQGYHWAMYQWGIIPKDEVDETKEKVPYIESYSPAYKPITIVMHSQGNAPGVGFALGAMKYANELGWEQIPLNLIFLGVHQPKNLWDHEYDKFIKARTQHFHADSDFWDTISILDKGLFLFGGKLGKVNTVVKQIRANKEDYNILKYLNGISELFSQEHHKLRNKRGIYEHVKAITDFNAIKERAVQFTFTNDHADIVCRDGDIPEIDSACDPKIDSTLFSVEFFSNQVPAHYAKDQGKEIVELKEGGFLVIPPYAAVPRLNAKEDKKAKDGVKIETWNDYRSIAIDWGNAMAKYKRLKKEYERLTGRKMTLTEFLISPLYKKGKEVVKSQQLKKAYRMVVYHYARIQIADLYAHFSPVEFIHNEKILESKYFEDSLGNTSIWERIKKAGESKFYRVEYSKTPKEIKDLNDEEKEAWKEQERIEAKNYVDGDGMNVLIDTTIANTDYIQNVINAYVHNDGEAKKQLYDEPKRSDKEIAAFEKLMKQIGDSVPEHLRKATEMKMPTNQEIEKIQKYIQSFDNE
ncbi:DUF4280 domain-containing protein [Pseudozobellia thermophila]|uniref:DUF4280 domain-containing protein n=1 Tax=Pseudozobellia thermophila TaxID=192903 RepID=A0A1M6M1V6_9FLAO|nr:DUF4280 domain-containing protein [Pseudozobellia thermophila]SHJ77432.1 protein of unknown function [Pseudozobellia thermophila]